MKPVNYASVDTDPESITPLYDNLLVRRLDEQEAKGLLILPGMTQTKDGRWVRKQDVGPRKGVVVAAGRGDKAAFDLPEPPVLPNVDAGKFGVGRHLMDVQVGDTILYPRFESSHVVIGGENYTFVHEADVLGVVEP